MQTSYDVALECLEGFEKNKQYVLCGRSNRILNFITGFMTRKAVLNLTGKMFRRIAG
jgi:short-subunit dehydrogenase